MFESWHPSQQATPSAERCSTKPELVAQKTKAAIDASLNVILCIGETLAQRESGATAQVNEAQLKAVVDVLKESDWRYVFSSNQLDICACTDLFSTTTKKSKIVIAYEPVWAIGTGKVATTAQAQDTQADIRAYLAKAVSPAVAEATRIIYGGSVTAANCNDLGQSSFFFSFTHLGT